MRVPKMRPSAGKINGKTARPCGTIRSGAVSTVGAACGVEAAWPFGADVRRRISAAVNWLAVTGWAL